jgi:hypothetical protein
MLFHYSHLLQGTFMQCEEFITKIGIALYQRVYTAIVIFFYSSLAIFTNLYTQVHSQYHLVNVLVACLEETAY